MELFQYPLIEKMLLFLVGLIFLNFLSKWFLNKLHYRFQAQDKIWKDSFVLSIYYPLTIFIWYFALLSLFHILFTYLYPDSVFFDVNLLFNIGLVLCATWFFMKWKKEITRLSILKSKQGKIALESAKIDVINKVATILILFLSVLMLLEITGRSLTTLIAFGGIGGLALAISSQEIIGNCFGGLMIYLTHPFGIGDWIRIPEKDLEGNVEEIGWYLTRIRTLDKKPVYVPNSLFAKSIVETHTRMTNRLFKESIFIQLGDYKNIEAIVKDIEEMLKKNTHIDQTLSIQVFLEEIANDALSFSVSAYTNTTQGEEFARIRQMILLQMVHILDRHQAKIAEPIKFVKLLDPIHIIKN